MRDARGSGCEPRTFGARVWALGGPSVDLGGACPDLGVAYLGIGGGAEVPAKPGCCTMRGGRGHSYISPSLSEMVLAVVFSVEASLFVINLLGTDLEEIFKGRPGELLVLC